MSAKNKTHLEEHSKIKLSFYRQYLEKYLPVMILTPFIKQINIFDLFCGKGIYSKGEFGSPIIALNVINNIANLEVIKKQGKFHPINLYINDKKDYVKDVEKTINEKNAQQFCNLKTYQLEYEQMFENCLGILTAQTKDSHNLFFIDPYGYKAIKKEQLIKLMENSRTEVMIFLPMNMIYRFLYPNEAERKKKRIQEKLLQGDLFNHQKPEDYLRKKQVEKDQLSPAIDFVTDFMPFDKAKRFNNVEEFIAKFALELKFRKDYFSSYIRIKRDSSNTYAVFFLTTHIYGLEKINVVKWDLDPINGIEPDLNLHPKLSKDALLANLTPLEIKLKELLMFNNSITNKDIYKLTIEEGFLPKHSNEIFKQWLAANLISITSLCNESIRKNAFYINWDNYKLKPKIQIAWQTPA